MNDKPPIVRWEPIKRVIWEPPQQPGSIEKDVAAERLEKTRRLVETLLTRGWVEVKAPAHNPPNRLFAVCRTLKNPECPTGTIDMTRHHALGDFTYGFTEGYIIDLIAEFPAGSAVFTPVGHRDVKIARFTPPDKPVVAQGNLAINRFIAKDWNITNTPGDIQEALMVADSTWGMNGVDVLPALDTLDPNAAANSIHTGELETHYAKHHIPPDTNWQNLGLGKLLIGLEFELLRQRGVHELKLESVSHDLQRILGKIPQTQKRIHLQSLPPETYQGLIAPFLLDEPPLPTPARSTTP